ncbi:glycosyltransferase [Pseudaminobacter arsenicus]|uniref:Glycosyltransferase n=1 Tax=Borborobacter arsenicus TaxID=1851146 RepID=A0A432V437_9HYPH|nr:glycosyltransferase family 4 protein [Pseudaminobacter arsenicus]RUM96919.1 glycosyltransferase [Pseudaminobacter arsenicus]
MKIAHLVSQSALNGVATSVKALIDEQVRAGHEIMLVHPRDSWIGDQSFAGPVKRLESSFKTIPADLRNTGYPIRDWGRTLVHAHGSRANKLLMIFTLADGAPAVMTAHARQFQLPWRFAHAVIGLSQSTADYYTKRLLVSRRRMHVVPNLFHADSLRATSAEARSRARAMLGIREEAFLLGTVGLICGRKRQVDALRILKQLVQNGLDAELLLVGGGDPDDRMPDWEALLADPVIKDRVHLPGQREDAVALTAGMDVYLCTSRAEQAPIAPLEAMAQEIPVLSTDVGNMPDLLPKTRIFPMGDIGAMAAAAEQFARNEDLRRRTGATDRATVIERLSPALILPRIERVYRAALGRASDRGWKYFKNPEDRWLPERCD